MKSALMLVTAMMVAGCSSGAGQTPPSSSRPTSRGQSPVVHGVPSPTAAQTNQLLAGLRKLRSLPKLSDIESVVEHARNVCQQSQAGESMAKLATYASQEFGNDQSGVSAADARRVIVVVRSTFCS